MSGLRRAFAAAEKSSGYRRPAPGYSVRYDRSARQWLALWPDDVVLAANIGSKSEAFAATWEAWQS